jgi:small subunit ribosomal protein S6
MNEYELMYIVHPEADEDAVNGINEQVTAWIVARGGQVSKTNVWGRRRLLFEIRKQNEGTYVVMNLQLAGAALAEVERNVKLHEKILRYMFVRLGD